MTSTPHVFGLRAARSRDVCMAKLLLADSVSVGARPTTAAPNLQSSMGKMAEEDEEGDVRETLGDIE